MAVPSVVRLWVENTDSSTITKLRVGDPIAHGIVTQIQIDAFEYETTGRRGWIEVGQSLTGEQVVARSTSAGTTQPSSLPNPNDPNLTIEQRMKLRRMQELNKK